jgi:hypothetical protein
MEHGLAAIAAIEDVVPHPGDGRSCGPRHRPILQQPAPNAIFVRPVSRRVPFPGASRFPARPVSRRGLQDADFTLPVGPVSERHR